MKNKQEVTEQDIRLPQFRDAKLEELEFDASGEVVRKDRFYVGMKKVLGILIEEGVMSSRETWTVDIVIENLKKHIEGLKDE